MKHGEASRTALGAAGRRAAHQALEGGAVFSDALAIPILGEDADAAIASARARPEQRGLRLFVAMRSRFAEDAARRALEAGVRQIVILGAGLDTFAYRIEPRPGLRVFEIDHPDTQRDKRRRLTEAKIAAPAHLSFVALDFDKETLTQALARAALDSTERAFVIWLGVTPYLTESAVFGTLGDLARLEGGAEIVFDYANPSHAIADAKVRGFHEALVASVAEVGEPFRCTIETAELHTSARALGYVEIEDLDRAALVARYLPHAAASVKPGPGGHVVRMATR